MRNVGCRERRPHGKEANSAEQGEASTSGQNGQPQYTHILCISPDAPTNPVLYWLGNFDPTETRFIMDTAHGPHKLDLGDTLYAPNLLEDEEVPVSFLLTAASLIPLHGAHCICHVHLWPVAVASRWPLRQIY